MWLMEAQQNSDKLLYKTSSQFEYKLTLLLCLIVYSYRYTNDTSSILLDDTYDVLRDRSCTVKRL